MSSTSDTEIPALLRELLAEVRALRADLAARVAAQPPGKSATALVQAIAALPRGTAFSVAELLEYAEVSPTMRAAILEAVGALNGKRLGKLLARIEGCDFDGMSIVRSGANREGVSWLCVFHNRKAVVARVTGRQA